MKKKVIFIGAGGYAKSVLDSLDLSKYEFCGFIDNFKPEGTTHLGYPILAKTIDDFQEREHYSFFISIGNNAYRLDKYLKLMKYRLHLLKYTKLCIPQFAKFLLRPINICPKMLFLMAVTSDCNNCTAKFFIKLEYIS